MPKRNPQPLPPSHDGTLTEFDRRLDQRKAEKDSIARQILNAGLIQPGDKVFIGLGTTCFYIAEALMREFDELYLLTHSVAVVRRYRELWTSQAITSPRLRVEITGGVVDPIMAYTKGGHLPPSASNKLIVAPHGIDHKGMGGFDAAAELRELVKHHGQVIVAATFEKFGRHYRENIRKWGKCTSHGTKSWTFVFPDIRLEFETLGESTDRTAIETILERIRTSGLVCLPATLPQFSDKK